MIETTNKNNFEIVSLDQSMKRRVSTILTNSYANEPTFQCLLDSNKRGYQQRVRSAIREMVNTHIKKGGVVLGVLDKPNDVICGVALLSENKTDLDIFGNMLWRLKMYLTSGYKVTHNVINFQNRIRDFIPNDNYKIITLLGIDPHYRYQGLGAQLIQSIHNYCDNDSDCLGIYLDSSNPKYDKFYRNLGYDVFTTTRFLSLDESLYLRLNRPNLS